LGEKDDPVVPVAELAITHRAPRQPQGAGEVTSGTYQGHRACVVDCKDAQRKPISTPESVLII
jgi:hypothetical protein